MVESEAIINSQPLTTDDFMCKETPNPLTPNHLLNQKSQVVLSPPGVFQQAALHSRKRWQHIQHLVNEFWQRWRKIYLQSLQGQQKWLRPHKNLSVGDIVILQDESTSRNCWKLARMDKVYPSEDGLVRKVKVMVGTDILGSRGKCVKPLVYLERPVHKLFLLVPYDEQENLEIPDREP